MYNGDYMKTTQKWTTKSEYPGAEANYVASHVNADQKFQAQQAAAEARAQASQAAAMQRAEFSAANRAANRDPATGYGVKYAANGGVSFHGNHGVPLTAAQYAQATGSNILDLLCCGSTRMKSRDKFLTRCMSRS